jgi:GH25 family lysozyme M1 (1,4-beta-N-acetylmuramidase)
MTSTARGVDVYSRQSVADWQGLDVDFIVAKVAEGVGSRDSRFAAHVEAARSAKKTAMGYFFGWPNESASAQVTNYVGGVGGQPVHAHWLDLEAYSDGRNIGSMTAAEIREWATEWIAGVRAEKPGDHLGVYASLATFRAGWVPTNADAYWVAEYPVVGLTWAQAEARARPTLPKGYPPPLLWQFGSQQPVIDRNLAYLSPADLAAWAAGGKEPDVAELTKAQVFDAVVHTDGVAAPSTSSTVKTNPTWTLEHYAQHLYDQNTALAKQVSALAAQVTDLESRLAAAVPDPASWAQQAEAALAALLAKGAQ